MDQAALRTGITVSHQGGYNSLSFVLAKSLFECVTILQRFSIPFVKRWRCRAVKYFKHQLGHVKLPHARNLIESSLIPQVSFPTWFRVRCTSNYSNRSVLKLLETIA